MEVDDGADLIQQFGCMQTLDHEDLISQMRKLIGDAITAEIARFYLEMNQWNVQLAVCSYFDFESSGGHNSESLVVPSMTFLRDATIGEGESVPPDAIFVKTWTVQNSGDSPWPQGCFLKFVGGSFAAASESGSSVISRPNGISEFEDSNSSGGDGSLLALAKSEVAGIMSNGDSALAPAVSSMSPLTSDGRDRIPVAALLPGDRTDVSVELHSPSVIGIYESKWRMCLPSGRFFGDTIWVILTVERSGTLALTQQMNNFHALGCERSTLPVPSLLNPFGSPRKDSSRSPNDDEEMN